MAAIIIPLAGICFVLLIVKMSIDHSKWKQLHRDMPAGEREAGEGKSLAVSELKALIQEAVEEANTPLASRLDQLEERLASRLALPPAEEVEDPNAADSLRSGKVR